MSQADDQNQPVLPGRGASDYERYLRTDELLSLQKRPEEMAHRDELLFQTVHQSSELWLKLACWEIEGATRLVRERRLAAAARLLRRAAHCVEMITGQIAMLEHMSPWDYQSIRRVLGHGSGFGSPGFNRVNQVTPPLGEAFEEVLRDYGLTLVQLYQRWREFPDLHAVAEGLLDWDHKLTLWRVHHFKIARRVIGGTVVGTAGTPVEILGKLIHKQRFSPLWTVRDELTAIAKQSEAPGDTPSSAETERVHVD
ncbi:MAG: tryptophan 2,3-dioxygenase family protein [Armatimonadota bacterium]|nr:tryptophan 2,3-dioxygenase family protein [Armatimonadota bacterium]